MIVKNYPSIDLEELKEVSEQVFDLRNNGDKRNILSQIEALRRTFLERNGRPTDKDGHLEYISDIVVLRAMNAIGKGKVSISDNQELFYSLSKNLQKNQREVRLLSLRLLHAKFE
jgi:hypothetical protein